MTTPPKSRAKTAKAPQRVTLRDHDELADIIADNLEISPKQFMRNQDMPGEFRCEACGKPIKDRGRATRITFSEGGAEEWLGSECAERLAKALDDGLRDIAEHIAKLLDDAAEAAEDLSDPLGYGAEAAEVYREMAAQVRKLDSSGEQLRRLLLGLATEAEENANTEDDRDDPYGYAHEAAEAYRDAAEIILQALGAELQ